MKVISNNRTIRLHFILIYTLAAFISLVIIVSSLFLTRQLTDRYNRYATVTEPMKYQLQAFNIDVNRQAALLQTYLLTGDESFREEGLQLLNSKLGSRIKLMYDYSDQLNDPALKVKVEELESNLNAIQANAKKLSHHSVAASAALVKKTFTPTVQASSSLLKELNAYLYDKHSNSFNKTIDVLESGQFWILGFFLLLMGSFYLMVRTTRHFIINHIRRLERQIGEIAKGNIPNTLPVPANEFKSIVASVNYLLQNLKDVKDFSLQVGKGDFDTNISVFDNQGALGTALAGMRQSLKEVSAEDKQRNWVNHGLAQFHSLSRQHNHDLKVLCYEVLSQLIKYVNANQGGVFILREEEEKKQLYLEASYAYGRQKFQNKVVQVGQGLAGQAFLEQEPIYLKEIPANYVKVTSGLGEATPTCLLVQPLKVNEQVVGVLEIAAFHDFPAYVQQFIAKVAESLGAAVATTRNNARNTQILKESQQLTEQLRAQEEELRQNTEELQATQEGMERLIKELQDENQQLKERASTYA